MAVPQYHSCPTPCIRAQAFLSVETAVNSQVKGNVLHNNRCFEIYGIDVLLDDALKPWCVCGSDIQSYIIIYAILRSRS